MDRGLYSNASKKIDPTMGYVLNKIAKEERNKEAWLKIARTMQGDSQNEGFARFARSASSGENYI